MPRLNEFPIRTRDLQIKTNKTPKEPTLHTEEVGGLGHHVRVYGMTPKDISWVHNQHTSFKLTIHELKIETNEFLL